MAIAEQNKSSIARDMKALACWMAGDFSNEKQAYANPTTYAHIHIFWRPLPYEFFEGLGFYSEQVYDYDLWRPYRQGVHRLVALSDTAAQSLRERIYIENYGLKDPVLYAGAARELDILKTIAPDDIKRREHCGMIFWREGEIFRGAVEGKNCLINRNGRKTYLVSEVELTAKTWVSLDKGMDVNTHEQVWGSKAGPLRFEKRQSFAEEVPQMYE
ncbi:MAG: chromophore lyase CpcT/CpeT [Hormoscilla sp. SP5CHS1]|nr:chromophore lyase CpcT/CpeT [Hormoscilla sp. SP5CHS1]